MTELTTELDIVTIEITPENISRLNVEQLRDLLVFRFAYTKEQAESIKGKNNLRKEILNLQPEESYEKDTVNVVDDDEFDFDENILDNLEIVQEKAVDQTEEQNAIIDKLADKLEDELEDELEEELEDELEEELDKDIVKADYISSEDYEWTDHVLSHLHPQEIIKDPRNDKNEYPTTDGLRRLVEKFIGYIISSHTTIHQVPHPDNNNRATVTVRVGILSHMNINQPLEFDGAADVYGGNSQIPFSNHPVATSETKAEGRAYKKALKIRASTYEEMKDAFGETSNFSSFDSGLRNEYINPDQLNFLDLVAGRLDINVKKFVKDFLPNLHGSYTQIPYDEAGTLLAILQKYQGKESNSLELKDELKGYVPSWKADWKETCKENCQETCKENCQGNCKENSKEN